jgi:hypothetical protein
MSAPAEVAAQDAHDPDGVLTDACTGAPVGEVAEDGSLLLDDGLVVPAESIEWVEPNEEVSHECEERTPGTVREALDSGSVLMLDYTLCRGSRCCGWVVIVWCWNGSCSGEGEGWCD